MHSEYNPARFVTFLCKLRTKVLPSEHRQGYQRQHNKTWPVSPITHVLVSTGGGVAQRWDPSERT